MTSPKSISRTAPSTVSATTVVSSMLTVQTSGRGFVDLTSEIAKFVNSRLQHPIMKPKAVGIAILAAFLLRLVDPGFGLILLFFPVSYVSECVRRAIAAPAMRPPDDPPSSS